jgi:hypothetical protein
MRPARRYADWCLCDMCASRFRNWWIVDRPYITTSGHCTLVGLGRRSLTILHSGQAPDAALARTGRQEHAAFTILLNFHRVEFEDLGLPAGFLGAVPGTVPVGTPWHVT